jgi:hypothetical protein
MRRELKIALFTEAARIINSRKNYSISVSLDHAKYKQAVPVQIYRQALGPYGAAFIAAALLNSQIATTNGYPDRVAYLIDKTTPSVSEQIVMAHSLIRASEKSLGLLRTAVLAFESDVQNTALQGSDAVAWSARRKHSGDGLNNEFAPLKEIFRERFAADGKKMQPHIHYSMRDDAPEKLMALLAAKGAELSKEARALLAKGDKH